MRSIAPMKAAKIGYIVLSVLMCAAGLMLILFPGISAKAIGHHLRHYAGGVRNRKNSGLLYKGIFTGLRFSIDLASGCL